MEIKAVSTSIPIFIGYSEKAIRSEQSVINEAIRIASLNEYEEIFGKRKEEFEVHINAAGDIQFQKQPEGEDSFFKMYYSVQLYFGNGGGPCYILSLGEDRDTTEVDFMDFRNALSIAVSVKEVSILVFPDAGLLRRYQFYGLYKEVLRQFDKNGNQFLIADIYKAEQADAIRNLRRQTGSFQLSYAAAYYPNLILEFPFYYDESEVRVSGNLEFERIPEGSVLRSDDPQKSIYHIDRNLYHDIKNEIESRELIVPPSAAIAAVFARTDEDRGVWKAPANAELNYVQGLTAAVDDSMQEGLNVDANGKSINAIRDFAERGIRVWGARTLDGNNYDWRYINQRRFCDMVKVSVIEAVEKFKNEPNSPQTWNILKILIGDFLMKQWRAGALQGHKFEAAAFVSVGLGETMTENDLAEGRLKIMIGLALMRPSEFTLLHIEQKLEN